MTFENSLLDQKRDEFRQRLGSKIPNDLNTDFNLDRWLINYELDLNACEEKFLEYLANRKALGFDKPEALNSFFDRKDVKEYCELFSLSKLDPNWINEKDNAIVFVETGVPEPSKVVKSIRVSDYLNIFFGYCEYFQRMVLEHEKKTGKRSYGICIFDMKSMSMLNYANPLAPINKLFQYRVCIWLEYYGELLKHAIIAHPPRFLGAVFKIMSLIMPEKMLSRFSFAYNFPDDIEKYISLNAIPIAYNGTKQFEKPYTDNGCLNPTELTKENYLIDGQIWQQHNVKIKYDHISVSTSDVYSRVLEVKKGQRIIYEFSVNRDVEFSVFKEKSDLLLPKFKMVTPVVSEEGSILIDEDTNVVFQFKNLSKLMKLKLKIATMVLDK